MYKFKTKPFKHQEDVLENSWDRPYYGLFMEMGLGHLVNHPTGRVDRIRMM